MFERNSYFTEDISINPTENRSKSFINAAANQRKAEGQLVCQIDLNRIVNFLSDATKPEREVQVCLVLKALKDRFMKLKSPYGRR